MCQLIDHISSTCGHPLGREPVPCSEARQRNAYCEGENVQDGGQRMYERVCLNCAGNVQAGQAQDNQAASRAAPSLRGQGDTILGRRAGDEYSTIQANAVPATRAGGYALTSLAGDAETRAEVEFDDDDNETTRGVLNESAARQREQDAELFAAQTEAAIQASMQEAQADEEEQMRAVLMDSQRENELEEAQVLEQVMNMSISEAEKEADQRHQVHLEAAMAHSQREFEQEEAEALHRVRMASVRAYTEDLSRQGTANRRPEGDVRRCGQIEPSNVAGASQRATIVSDDSASTVTARVDNRSQRSVASGHWRGKQPSREPSIAELPGSTPQHLQDQQSSARTPNPATAGYEWTRPPPVLRSPSPTTTIRTAEGQRAHQERMRNSLYDRHPKRPPPEAGPSNYET